MYLTCHALADVLGGEDRLIRHYDITTRDSLEAITACIASACEDYGVSIGRGAEGQPFTFTADVRDLASRLLDMCPVAKAASVVPIPTRWTPTIGTLQALFGAGRLA